MFDLPSDLDITRVVVTPESVGGEKSPELVKGKRKITTKLTLRLSS